MNTTEVSFKSDDEIVVINIDKKFVRPLIKIMQYLHDEVSPRTSYELSDGSTLCGYCHHVWRPSRTPPLRCAYCQKFFVESEDITKARLDILEER